MTTIRSLCAGNMFVVESAKISDVLHIVAGDIDQKTDKVPVLVIGFLSDLTHQWCVYGKPHKIMMNADTACERVRITVEKV